MTSQPGLDGLSPKHSVKLDFHSGAKQGGMLREKGPQQWASALATRAIFRCQLLFARVDEKIWPIFMPQMYLRKSWRVSFFVTNNYISCHIRYISRVAIDDSSHKMWQIPASH